MYSSSTKTDLHIILSRDIEYDERSHAHVSLEKDAPIPRQVATPSDGRVMALAQVGGLQHATNAARPDSLARELAPPSNHRSTQSRRSQPPTDEDAPPSFPSTHGLCALKTRCPVDEREEAARFGETDDDGQCRSRTATRYVQAHSAD